MRGKFVDAPVMFAGDQTQFPGLDQINVQIPASLRGPGEVAVVVCTIDGLNTNPVTISVPAAPPAVARALRITAL